MPLMSSSNTHNTKKIDMNNESAKKAVDDFNKEQAELIEQKASDLIDDALSEYEPSGQFETLLTTAAKDRRSFVADFRFRRDKVIILDVIVQAFCNYLISKPTDIFDIYAIERIYSNSAQVDTDDLLMGMLKAYIHSSNRVRDLISSGAYLYATSSHLEPPLGDATKEYEEALIWEKNATSISDLKKKSFNPYTTELHNKLYVSRSELNQLLAFTAPASNKSEYQKGMRRTAYRAHLKSDLVDTQKEEFFINEQRELVLIGWMIGKGFTVDGIIKGYSQKKIWSELEKNCPDYFNSKSGQPLSAHSIKPFFKECRKKGICRFK
jgi:hypothetical protein